MCCWQVSATGSHCEYPHCESGGPVQVSQNGLVGAFVGFRVGAFVGFRVGAFVGLRIGAHVGLRVGEG